MSDLFDTSKIRDEPEYWDELAERVSTHALERRSTFALVAESRASWLAAALAVAAAMTLLLLPSGVPADPAVQLANALAPTDDMGKAITGFRPPAIGTLLLGDHVSGGAR